jgi:DNA-binding LytR/AlgR family response regulator
MPKSLHIYIVEDEPLIAETIKVILEDEGYTVCGTSDNAKEAIYDIETMQPDLILLDIMLDGTLDGVDMMKHLQKKRQFPFIYLTSLSDPMTLDRVKETNPSGYIVKPFNENTLISNIELAYYKYIASKPTLSVNQENDSFFIKNKGELIKIQQSDILYIEAYDNYCNLYTKLKKHLISQTLKTIEEKLPSNKFLRVHRSYIINFSKIDSIQDGYIFIGSHKISVSRSHKDALMKVLNLL